MYQKEIIYMGLHKDGSRLGSAGFLKVESRDQDSSLYLKVKNIPHSINGRFPVRFYNGTVWKEVDGITLQEGSGLWEEKEPDFLRQVRLQIILPSGYLIEGISREAQQKMDGHREYGDIAEKGTAPRREKQGIQPEADLGRYTGSDVSREKDAWNLNDNDKKTAAMDTTSEGTAGKNANRDFVKRSNESWDVEEGGGANREIVERSNENKDVEERGGAGRDIIEKSNGNSDIEQKGSASRDTEEQKDIIESDDGKGNMIHRRPDEVERISVQKQRRSIQETSSEHPVMVSEELPPPMADKMQVNGIKEDKWEQILDTYDQIHPYGDERVYVKLEPKDFVILQAKYQHLVNNSFLLHGFYNYRYVILGKENEYYLGVPGVFYEREKMVALMFGFEAFECQSGEAKPGDFGYYLRRVEL